jgi:hypothetical protein
MESCNGILKTEVLSSRFGKTNVKDRRIPIVKIVKAAIDFISYYSSRRPKEQFKTKKQKGTWPMLIQEVDRI